LQSEIDLITSSKAHPNNYIKILLNGEHSFKQRWKNIESADFIFIKTYEFWDDETSHLLLKKLTERANSGTKIFVQFDVKGNNDYTHLIKILYGHLNPIPPILENFFSLNPKNIYLIPTSIPYRWTDHIGLLQSIPNDHEKYFITWKRGAPVRVIMGGLNIGDMYAFTGFKDLLGNYKTVPYYVSKGYKGSKAFGIRDTDVEIVGTVNSDIVSAYIERAEFTLKNPNRYFKNNLLSQIEGAVNELKNIKHLMDVDSENAFPNHAGRALLRFISTPQRAEYQDSNIEKLLIKMLRNVPDNSKIHLITPLFLPPAEFVDAMKESAKRGVNMDILTSDPVGTADPDFATSVMAAHCFYRKFLKEKTLPIQIYEWKGNIQQGIGSTLHQKVYSFGNDRYAPFIIGSVNLDSRSLKWDSESCLLIQSAEDREILNNMLNQDFSKEYSSRITLKDLSKESFIGYLKECILNLLNSWF
jgi:phosphatidylserine/phosphatidylglycerophosphate/cardiolipin synthase-like enzyme